MRDRRRLFIAQLAFTSCFLLLMARLLWIQAGLGGVPVFINERIIASSVWQREQGVILDSGRGHFYDRHQRPLTGYTYESLVIMPLNDEQLLNRTSIRRLVQLLGINEEQWDEIYSGMTEPDFWRKPGEKRPIRLDDATAEEIRALQLPGIVVAPVTDRYGSEAPAAQLIGFVGQHPERVAELYKQELEQGRMTLSSTIGGSGLEKVFDRYLQSKQPTMLSYFVDAKQRPIEGLRMRLYSPDNPFYPIRVKTTLDLKLQQEVEQLLDQMNVSKGAVVLLDARSADVMAMSSRPKFNPLDVNMEHGEWANLALKSAIPGSIFKTIVAAAALEYNRAAPRESFICNGSLGKYGLRCWKRDGHGHLTLEEAYAVSCNVVFAELAERLSAEEIESIAKRLGIVQPIGWMEKKKQHEFRQFDAEEAGSVFASDVLADDGGIKALTCFGQRDVRMTPLAAANLVVTLLNNGELKHPRVVSELSYANGVRMKAFRTISEGQVMKRSTAQHLKRWMKSVVEEGTGQGLKYHTWSLAGKTGTAQVLTAAGWGENEWFIGFGPTDNPRYAAAVLVQKEKADAEHQAMKVFEALMYMLADVDQP